MYFRAQGTCLVPANVVLSLLNETLKIAANVVVSECTVYCRVLLLILRNYFFTFYFGFL